MHRIVLVVLLVVFLASPATAWNGKGHMVVAYIAYQHLDPAVKGKVARLLQINPDYDLWVQGVPDDEQPLVAFMLASTWPDSIKRQHGYVSDGTQNGDRPSGSPDDARNIGYTDHFRHKYWHFVDQPFSTDGTPVEVPPSPNAETEISLLKTALQTSQSDDTRSYDLVWLEHLVGDVHQPLHTTSRFTRNHPHGDAGGNLVPLCSAPCKAELHAFWDSVLGEEDVQQAMSLGQELDSQPVPDGANDLNIDDWIRDSSALARQEAYKPPISDDEPGSAPSKTNRAYRSNAQQIAEAQVVLAGRRLAGLLNASLH